MNKKITIIGSGLSGYFSAMKLQYFRPKLEYEIISDKNIPTIGVGESGILDLPLFIFEEAQINVNDFYHEVHPIHKLGINFRDWVNLNFNYNFSFDSSSLRTLFNYSDYILDPTISAIGSFMIDNNLSPIVNNLSIYKNFSYQIDNLKFVSFLKKVAIRRGIKHIDKKIIDIEFEKENKIKNIIFEDNEKHQSDFYVDCSGFNSIISKKLKLNFNSFKNKLPCDYAVVGQHEISKEEIKSYTVSTRKPYGWQWEIDTSERAGKGYVFCSDFTTKEEATEQFLKDNPKIKSPRIIPFPSGKYENICGENYILNGNSQGFAEPLESTGFSMVLSTITTLNNFLDENLFLNSSKQKIINDYCTYTWSFIVDFLVLHYKYNSHINNNGFWEFCDNELKLSDEMLNIIHYFKNNEANDFNYNEIERLYWSDDPIFNIECILVHLNARNLLKVSPNDYVKDKMLEYLKKIKNKFLKESQLIDYNYNSIDFEPIIKNKKNHKEI